MAEWSRPGVVPVDPHQRGQFDLVDGLERSVELDALGLVEPDHRLGHRIVVAVSDAADGGQRPGLAEALVVADGCVLTPGIGVMNQPIDVVAGTAADPQRHLQGVERQFGRHPVMGAPADDPTGEHVGDERSLSRLLCKWWGSV